MAIKGLTVSGGKVYQEIDLSDMFGADFSGQEALKLSIGQEIIDYMRDRTSKGKDYNGEAFAKYSESYKKSDEYEAYGKSSKVNMSLTGDMLASIDLETSGNLMTFVFDDAEDEAKAFGHMSGMEGHKHLDGKTPKRLFFGISQDEINTKILPKFKGDIDALKADSKDFSMSLEEALGFTSTGSTGGRTLEDLLGDL